MKRFSGALILFVLISSLCRAQFGPWLPAGEYQYREFNVDPLLHVSAQIQTKVAYKGKMIAWRIINISPDPVNIEITVQYMISCEGSAKIKEIVNARPIQPGLENAIRYSPVESDPKRLGKGFMMMLDYCLDDVELKDIVILKHTVTPIKAPVVVTPVIPDIPLPGPGTSKEADRDNDLISDKLDWCPDVFGLKQYHGCPPPEKPGQVVNAQAVKSIAGSVKPTPVKFSVSNYDKYIDSKSTVSDPVATKLSQYGIATSFNRYFGTRRMIGAQVGLEYDYVAFNLERGEFHVEYQAEDAGQTTFRRIIYSKGPIVEKVKMQQLRIPIELILSDKLGNQLNYFFGIGPVVSLSLGGKSSVNATLNYEAVYSPGADGNINNNDAFSAEESDNDWLLTEEFVNGHASSNTAANDYFTGHYVAGYEVAANHKIEEDVDFKLKPSIGIIVEAGIDYKISEMNLLRIGLQWISTSYKSDSPESYQLSDKVGEYSSMMNGMEKISTSIISFKLGFSFGLE